MAAEQALLRDALPEAIRQGRVEIAAVGASEHEQIIEASRRHSEVYILSLAADAISREPWMEIADSVSLLRVDGNPELHVNDADVELPKDCPLAWQCLGEHLWAAMV